jgi:uncharacterized protein
VWLPLSTTDFEFAGDSSMPEKTSSAPSPETPSSEQSPTTSIRSVLLALAGSVTLSVLLGAQGIIHAAHGMSDGPERNVALAAGNVALAVSRDAHVSGVWNTAQAALGRPQDTGTPPLLAAVPPLVAPAVLHRTANKEHGSTQEWKVVSRPVKHHAQKSATVVHPKVMHPRAVLPRPTRARPLRLLITGDSLPGYMGPQILSALAPSGRVRGWTDVHDGTGLTRPDYVDWSVVARQQVGTYAPQAVIVLMGGNDFQNMVLPNGRVLIAGSKLWTQEYARRAAVCMRIWAQGGRGHRVYWLSMPPSRDPVWAFDDRQIDRALQMAAKRVQGVSYVNVLGPITDHGKYVDYARVGGVWTLIREPDGVHLNMAGSQVVANEVVPMLRRQWRL